MSVDKVQAYVDRVVKSNYRKGYLDLLDLVQEKDTVQGLHALGSIDRVTQLVGIGTNNRADNFPFDVRYLSVVEKLEQRAQQDFNKEYMHRIEELDKLRISDAVSQISRSLQDSSIGSIQELKAELQKSEDSELRELSKGSFEIPSFEEDDSDSEDEVASSNELIETDLLSKEDDDFIVSDTETGEVVSFLSLFPDLE